VLQLIALSEPLRLSASLSAALSGGSTDPSAPVIAVPIVFRGSLDAIVLYGAHRSGEDLDPEEIDSLDALARAAAAAYDHLDAESTRLRLARMEEEVTRLKALA